LRVTQSRPDRQHLSGLLPLTETTLPDAWPELVTMISSLRNQMGFDIETVVRSRLHLHAESVHPGRLHNAYRPTLERSLDLFADRLQQLANRGGIGLRMSARQTAMCMSALIDGMLWIALASDRPLKGLGPEIAAGLACL
jgi:hypothetical protein